MKLAVSIIIVFLLASCASKESVQKKVDMVSSAEVKKRAAFDLSCPAEQVSAKRIAGAIIGNLTFGAPNGSWRTEGCGKNAVYQVICNMKTDLILEDQITCNPMLESSQSTSQINQNAAGAAANAAAQAAAARATQQQFQQQQFQQQQYRQQQQQQQMYRR